MKYKHIFMAVCAAGLMVYVVVQCMRLSGPTNNQGESTMFWRKKVVVPEWASVLGPKEYTAFMAAVNEYFQQQGELYTIGDGMVSLDGRDLKFGLGNLVQLCGQVAPEEYPEVIARHFGMMTEVDAFRKNVNVDQFETIEQYLGVRLYDQEYMAAATGDVTIHRPFAGNVFAVLVYDYPQSVECVLQRDTAKWGKTEDELFAIGMENIRRNYPLEANEVTFGDDSVFVVETEHFFAPNILFDLEQHQELVGKSGAIVAIPVRNMVMIYPIHDIKVVKTLNMFFTMIPRFYAEGPGSLTREIYWYHDGQYESLKYESGEEIRFAPSDEFMAVLNSFE